MRFISANSTHLLPFGKALKKAKNSDYTILQMPELNHRFQHCKIGIEKEYREIEETIAPEVLKITSNWIMERTTKNKGKMDKKFKKESNIKDVFLNHVYVRIDEKTYEEIKKSDFLKNNFGHCEEKTHSGSRGMTWTGIYLTGQNTYFEFFNNKDRKNLEEIGTGKIGIGFSIDRNDEMVKITELLKQKFSQVSNELFEKNIENRLVPWFHYVTTSSMMPELDTWIMSYNPEYLKFKNVEVSNDIGITREYYNKTCNAVLFDEKKLFKDIEEVTLFLNDELKKKFVQQQILLGYDCENIEDDAICHGAGITFILKSSGDQTSKLSKLQLRLNRNIQGKQVYKFGNSTLELEKAIAVWTFN